ncbi:MAG: aminobutyraldehyde dehydrogenase [Propionibacteriaceae bacterium]|nr:aminobutyraldehyde dehydrogenase [Propionibacteriaceae bacterium]
MAPTTLQNFVGGQWVDSFGTDVSPIVNPATGEVIAQAPRGTEQDVERAVSAAEAALPEWMETTPGERASMLLRLADAVQADATELFRLESSNVGKPRSVGEPEIDAVVDNLRFIAGAARVVEVPGTGEYLRGYTSMVRREPLGVAGLIAPWNYPLMMAVWKVAPALAAGNTCVLKPSRMTPLSMLRFAELAREILPAGVMNIITGDGSRVGNGLVAHPSIRVVSLTGDTATGKAVMATAAQTITRVHLELGGKAPVVVFADANLEAVAEGVKVAGYWNAGQECAAACRILVDELVYDDLIEVLVPAIQSLKVGDAGSYLDADMGPVISAQQRDQVMGYITRSTGTILTGGKTLPGPGFWVEPTLITDVAQTDEIVQREVFGPVVTIQKFSGEEQGLAWANDVNYGLCASAWTSDVGRSLRAARQLRFGTVWLNDHLPLVSEMPWTGMGESGIGRDMSRYVLDDYSQVKHVMASLA